MKPAKTCNTTGKVMHSSESEALRSAVYNVGKHGTSHLRVYFCHYCESWHLTKRKKK
jgi:hypothetical protein